MTTKMEDALNALRSADKQGNEKDAQRLAIIIHKMRSGEIGSPEEYKEPPAIMPWVNKSIAETLTFIPEGIAQGISAIPGVDISGLPREYIKKGFETIGAPLPEEGRQPESMGEHVGRGVGEVASLLIPGGAVTKTISKGTGLSAKIATNIYSAMVKHPYMTMTSEITSGIGMGAGRGAVAEETENETLQGVGEMVGAVAGGAAPFLMPTTLAYRYGKPLLKKLSVPFTKGGQKYRAGEHLKGMVPDPSKTARTIGEETIGDLPPVVQSGEKRLISLHKSLLAQDPIKESEAIEDITKSILLLENEMRQLGYGSPELLADVVRRRIMAIETNIDQRILKATQKAQDRLDALPVARRQSKESAVVRQELERVFAAEKKIEGEVWKEVPKDVKVGVDLTRAKYAEILEGLSIAEKIDIPNPLKTNPILAQKDLPETTVKEMQGLRSKLLEVHRQAKKKGQWNKSRIAYKMADAVLGDLDAQKASKELREAISLTKHLKDRYESGVVGKILGYDKTGAPAISPELTLDISIGRAGAKGSIDIDKVVVTPEARAATEKYLTRSWTDFSLDNDRVIDPIKSRSWITNNEDILDQFPNLRTQMQDVSSAQDLAKNSKIAMDARKARLRNPSISYTAKFLNSTDLNQSISTILKDVHPIRMTRELTRQARKDATGRAMSGLRAGFLDRMMDKSTASSFNELGEQTLSGKHVLGFINNHESILKEVFDPSQISRMRRVGLELSKIESFKNISAGKPDLEMKDLASSGLRLFARITGARIGGAHGRDSAGGSLQMAQIYSGKAKEWVTKLTKDRAEEMIKDAILSKDPKLLQALLAPLNRPSSKTKNLKFLGDRLNVWLAGSGKRVIDDILTEKETP